tara:strand:- start:80 stop:232 length:153 start_codon:yes stop_codon:yes gene_type:complete
MALRKFGSEARTNNFVTRMAEQQPSRDISPIMLRQIAKDMGLSLEEFLAR